MTAVLTRPVAFDVCGDLPTGTTVLEASAGTGKTFTIAALAARYVAEGHARLPELLLVTFGREATQELRERVRERLLSAERALRDPAAARAGTDSVSALLANVPDDEAALRRRRLTAALAEFDAATIATTHQFCGQMLTALGIAGDTADAVFVESVDDLVVEVVDDFYVRKFAAPGAGTPAFERSEALRLARRAVGDPQARLEPAGATGTAATRHAFATAVRGEVERRKRVRGLHTYDDLVTRLHDALADPVRGGAARLRARYRVVLVDEFQDTDPLQWGILRHFAGHVPLVLIGDPKQAIYAFRGADVVSYLDAVGHADAHATLARNWRSDAGVLRGLGTVFGGAALGDPRIVVRDVESAHPVPRLAGAPVDAPLRVRVLARDGLPCSGRGLALTADARREVARDAAADIAALLASGATVTGAALRPGDVAVLVRTNDQGTVMRDALAAVGRPGRAVGHRERVRHPCGARVADAAARVGAAAADPHPRRGADLLPRPDRSRAVRARLRRAARRAGCDPAPLGGRAARQGGGGAAGGGHHRHRPARAPARRHGRRAAADRRPAHRAGAARRGRRRAPRPGGSGGVAAPPHRRGRGGRRARAQQAARLRRRRGPDHHRAPQQGAGVPRGVRAVRLGPVRPARAGRAPAARRRRRPCARRRRDGRAAVVRALRAPRGRGGGRGPAAAVRGADPRPVPGGDVVGAGDDGCPVAAAPAAVRTARPGRDAARVVPGPERRRGADGAERARGSGSRGGTGPRPSTGVLHGESGARRRRSPRPRSPARWTWRGGGRRTAL